MCTIAHEFLHVYQECCIYNCSSLEKLPKFYYDYEKVYVHFCTFNSYRVTKNVTCTILALL